MRSTKLYIILTDSIVKIGGAEIYVRNKCNYLKKEGWDVLVFSMQEGEMQIEDLKEYKSYIRKELQIPPFAYTPKKRKNLIDNIVLIIKGKYSRESILESNSLHLSLWGELIAQQLQAKHLLYSLEEGGVIKGKGLLDFLLFKHQRREFAGISPKTLPYLFAPFFQLPPEEADWLIANCSNPIEDIECKWLSKIPTSDYCIASLGRLEKPYLQTVLTDIKEFVSKHSDKTFSLLFIGGERTGNLIQKQIKKLFAKFTNVHVFITGFLFPIPLSLIRKVDVFLSSAGSASATFRLGIPTISYDAKDLQPIGIMGKTTKNSMFRDNEAKTKGCDLLQEILLKKKYDFAVIPFVKNEPDYSSHLRFISESNQDIKYFNFSDYELGRIEKAKMLVYKCSGYYGYKIIGKCYSQFCTKGWRTYRPPTML